MFSAIIIESEAFRKDSTMRVITGSKRGHKLVTLEGTNVRPTTDRVKEALFSIIQFDIEGRTVLDLFAGSAQLGIEALSRGATFAVFVEKSKEAIGVIEKNLINTSLQNSARILNKDYVAFLNSKGETFDIAFLDPPYDQGILEIALPLTIQRMSEAGLIVCEHSVAEILPQEIDGFVKQKDYKYGTTVLTVYRRQS